MYELVKIGKSLPGGSDLLLPDSKTTCLCRLTGDIDIDTSCRIGRRRKTKERNERKRL